MICFSSSSKPTSKIRSASSIIRHCRFLNMNPGVFWKHKGLVNTGSETVYKGGWRLRFPYKKFICNMNSILLFLSLELSLHFQLFWHQLIMRILLCLNYYLLAGNSVLFSNVIRRSVCVCALVIWFRWHGSTRHPSLWSLRKSLFSPVSFTPLSAVQLIQRGRLSAVHATVRLTDDVFWEKRKDEKRAKSSVLILQCMHFHVFMN